MTSIMDQWRLTHAQRRIKTLDVWRFDGWTVKAHGIFGVGETISQAMIDAAYDLAHRTLPQPALTACRYGACFLIIHEAAGFNTIAADWWQNTNELNHRFFRAPAGASEFSDITTSGESACVWELRIQGHERDLWLAKVLSRDPPDWEGYFTAALDEWC